MQLKVLCSHLISLLPLFLASLAQAEPVYAQVENQGGSSVKGIDKRGRSWLERNRSAMPDLHKTDVREDGHKRLTDVSSDHGLYDYQEMFGLWLTIPSRVQPRLEWVKSGTDAVFHSSVTFDRVA